MIRSGLEYTFSVDIICVLDNHDLVNFNTRCVCSEWQAGLAELPRRPPRPAELDVVEAGCLRGALGRIVADDEEMGICRRVAG